MLKWIFVTGGVVSSIGKGITTACLGALLQASGYRVVMLKIDPYLNVDAGTMAPLQHGEVFVTEDGAETDLDLGHYERFTDLNLNRHCNVTTGSIYSTVIERERRGGYLGQTVQVIPHLTEEIKKQIRTTAQEFQAEVAIVEIGGTVGDIESLPFLEAIRQMKTDEGEENTLYLHVSLIPFVGPRNELKTKPTQHSVRKLREVGIQPNILLCRTKAPLTLDMREKISSFCGVALEAVIEGLDTENIYALPLIFEKQGLAELVTRRLRLSNGPPDLRSWQRINQVITEPKSEVTIGLVGKYFSQPDAYISVMESLKHAGIQNQTKVTVRWIDSEELENAEVEPTLKQLAGIVVPGGFGHRGIEGKIAAITFARRNDVPFLGLCLGLQCATIEFARNVGGLIGANSTEFDPNATNPVIDILDEQRQVERMGGTMRRGACACQITGGTQASKAYASDVVQERHRHRFEVNPRYHYFLRQAGLVFSGMSPDGQLVEIIELPDHPYFVACQFHPEFKSRPNRAHPLFRDFIKAAKARQDA